MNISFLSLRVFRLLSSSLLLFPQHFGRYVLQPSSGICQTLELSQNFKLRPLLNPRGSPILSPENMSTETLWKDEDNSPKTLNDKNHQASSQKFRQLNISYVDCKKTRFSCIMFIFQTLKTKEFEANCLFKYLLEVQFIHIHNQQSKCLKRTRILETRVALVDGITINKQKT